MCRCRHVECTGPARHNEWASSTRSVQEVHRNSLPKYQSPISCSLYLPFYISYWFAEIRRSKTNRRQTFVKPPDDLEFIFSKPMPHSRWQKGRAPFCSLHLSEKSCLGSETAIPSDCQPLRSSITKPLKAFCYWF